MLRSWNYNTNASWTGQIGVKTMILQAFYCSGKSVINLKTYFSFKPKKLHFQNGNAYSGSMPRTTGSNRWKLEVSLAKMDLEGVLSFLSRWSRDERLGLDGGGKRVRAIEVGGGDGGVAIAAVECSPALAKQALRWTIFKLEINRMK
jgi:hypothetical protein